MHRRTKIIVIASVVLLAVGAGFFFRKPRAPSADSQSLDIAWQAPQTTQTAAAEKPAPASHLTGQIEPAASGGSPWSAATGANGGSPNAASASASAAGGFSPLPARAAEAFAEGPADAPAATANADSATREQVIHRIADGETLTQLAERYLGSADRYQEIFALNRDRLTSSDLLPIGVELRIPGSAKVVASPSAPVPGRMVPIAPRPQSGGPGASAGRTYRVERNDTLSGIAKKIYGDARRYRDILEANRHQLNRPEELREGAVLIIP